MVTPEEAIRIMAESDLIVPESSIETTTTDPKLSFLQEFGKVIVGGIISGGIFFGLGRFLDWFSLDVKDEQTEDQI